MRLINTFAVVTLALAVGASADTSDATELLLVPGFKLEARLKVIRENSLTGLDEDIIVKEYYSNAARRARLDLLEHDVEDKHLFRQRIRYYYHGSQNQMIKTTSLEGLLGAECSSTTAKDLVGDLFGALSRSDKQLQAKEWLLVSDPLPNYVIGLTRLLLLAKLLESQSVLKSEDEPLVRNQPCIKYMLTLPGGRTLAIYYSKLRSRVRLELPLRIWMAVEGGGELIVDYSNVEMFGWQNDKSSRPAEDEGADLLSFPTGIGCSKRLTPAKILNSLIAPRVVSFRAEIRPPAPLHGEDNPIKSTFVAYDGFLRMLRFDTVRSQERQNQPDEYSISIYEIVRHRKYNIRQQIHSSDGERGQITLDKSRGSQCASSKLFAEGLLNPFEPILPLEDLVEMGAATVRGMKARVFERVSSALPPMLFLQVNYATVDGKITSQFDPEDMGSPRKEYYITYYFAEQEVSSAFKIDDGGGFGGRNSLLKLGPLLRIDIHQQGLMYRVEIRDFLWQLAEAPNGDRQDELFSLYDRCSTPEETKANTHVQLSMDLEYDSANSAGFSVAEAGRMLESPITRNKALIRALCDASEQILAKQIHDIETKMLVRPDKLMLRTSARLSGQSLILYEAISIGTGLPKARIQITGANNFDDCYWDAVHKRKEGHQLLFSYCFNLCLFDENPQLDYSSNNRLGSIKGSLLFSPFEINNGKAYPCQVLKLELQPDEIADKVPSRSIYKMLRGSSVRLPLTDSFGGSKRVESVAFKVKQIDLSNEKWTPSLRDAKGQLLNNRDELLNGLALSLDEASLIKTPKPVSTMKQNTNDDKQSVMPQMSYDTCHSTCMANLSCLSFSVCANGKQTECLVSSLGFRDITVFDQISEKLAKLSRTERTRGSLMIDFPIVPMADKNGEDQQQRVAGSRRVELKLNSKCRIYNKYAMEMFRLTERVSIRPPEKYLIPADDEEQCASSCLRTNVRFFKRMAEIRLRMLNQSRGDGGGGDYMNELLERQSISMKYWCESFKYLNLASSVEPYYLDGFVAPDKLTKDGLCLLARIKSDGVPDGESKQDAPPATAKPAKGGQKAKAVSRLMFQSYEFAYTMLYEKHPGVQLKPEEHLRGSHLELLANFQLILNTSDEDQCARACFLQTTVLKPFCRSFGIVFGSDQMSSFCVLNSITLAEARQRARELEGATGEPQEAPIMLMQPSQGAEVWHFEPKSAYSLDHLILAQLTGSPEDSHGMDSEPFNVGLIGILTVVVASLISGLLVGLVLANRLGRHVSSRRESIENPSRSFLNSLVGSDNNSSNVSHRRFEPDVDLPGLGENVGL